MPKAEILSPSAEQIERLRSDFLERLNRDGAPCEGGFHPNDIDRIKSTDIWLQRFLEQEDLDPKASLNMLWNTCKWRKEYGTNDITENNINMEYMEAGLSFPHNRDIDGKPILVLKSKLHIRGARDNEQLFRIFIYWMERLNREGNYDTISLFFDLAGTGLKNLDLEYTKHLVDMLKQYYPNNLNYIFVFELPWILTAAFNIIKALLPPKAVAALRFVNSKNLNEYISEDNMLTCWGGTDDYQFKFSPDANGPIYEKISESSEKPMAKDENDNTALPNGNKKVNFADTHSSNEIPMSDMNYGFVGKMGDNRNGPMLKITPAEIIPFTKVENELVGTVDIQNIVKFPITYKIKTTSPEKFRVRPSSGILLPGNSTTISVVLQPGPNVTLLLNKDKFLVMCMEMKDLNASPQEIAEIWKNTQNNSQSVEQHRLRCNVGGQLSGSSSIIGDQAKNSSTYLNNGGIIDSERQWLHVSISQLTDTTRRLESRVKFNQKLQWFTVLVFLLLSIAIVYILKLEIHNNNTSEHCPSRSKFHNYN